MTKHWALFLGVLLGVWTVGLVFATVNEPELSTFRWYAVAFAVEALMVLCAVRYLWTVRNETGEPASWLLWLFLFGAVVMFVGLIPGTLIMAGRALELEHIVEWPGLVLALSILLIGTVPVTTSIAIWHRRNA